MRVSRAVARLVAGAGAVVGIALLGSLLNAAPARANTVLIGQAGTADGSLASTGGEAWIVALIAAVLVMTGLALLLLMRLRRPVVPRSLTRSQRRQRR